MASPGDLAERQLLRQAHDNAIRGVTLGKAFAPLFRLAYSADRLFRVFKKHTPLVSQPAPSDPDGLTWRADSRKVTWR